MDDLSLIKKFRVMFRTEKTKRKDRSQKRGVSDVQNTTVTDTE